MGTLADVEKTLDRIARSMEESDRRSDKRREEMERMLTESRAETERALAESRAEAERMLADYRAETERMRTETERMRTETQRILAESRAETELSMRQWSSRIGNDIGYIVEVVLVPGIKEKMNEFGHNFTSLSVRHTYYRPDKKKLAEVDVLLQNGDEAMAVEVKTSLTADKVQPCVEKLKKLRENETITHLAGKKLYAAIAGLNVTDDARKLALSLGMYVIEMYEDKSFITVTKPETKVAVW